MLQLQSGFGVFALLMLAWACGEHRDRVSLRQTLIGLAVTLGTAALMLKLPGAAHAFGAVNDAVGVIAAARITRLIVAASCKGFSATTSCAVEQFGLAMILRFL